MPITRTEQVAYTMVKVALDLNLGSATVTLQQSIAGVAVGVIPMEIAGQDLAEVLHSVPDGTSTLGDSFTAAVYALAIKKGVVSGAVA